MKCELMSHQKRALELMKDRGHFALFCEQGTGKTVMLLADAERLYQRGDIDALLVIAPNGVHRNWILREVPKHLEIPWRGAAYKSGSKPAARKIDELHKISGALKIMTINIDAMNTKKGLECAQRFCREHRTMVVVDESTRIKNPKSKRSQKVCTLTPLATYRRIASGRPITKEPQDIYQQFHFLKPGLFPVKTHAAFVARYCSVLPEWHPLVQHIMAKSRARRTPQVVERDDSGAVVMRNADELKRIIDRHSFIVKKRDCLDLPPKIYEQALFELTPELRRIYDDAVSELALINEKGERVIPFEDGAVRMKLRQITSGFIINNGTDIISMSENPRAAVFKDLIADVDGQFIVWASFNEEIRQIAEILDDAGISFATYTGATPRGERDAIIDDFQAGEIRAFVGNPAAAGIGITLTAAETAIFYSNSDDVELRTQAEDRCHRIGSSTARHVVYIDLIAENTVDERIVEMNMGKISLGDSLV